MTNPVIIGDATLWLGDALQVLPTLAADSIDSVVTDPPYHFGFMGKAWDRGNVAFRPETWAAVLRIAKPGAHLVAFGGTRTHHRLMCAIEDAGWEIRDTLGWLYGSGFPKSLDVSKAIDKAAGAERPRINGGVGSCNTASLGRFAPGEAISGEAISGEAIKWQGWGTALKPAWEIIILARKPLIGTVAANVQQHGTGALNIDGCRVPMSSNDAEKIEDMGGFGKNGYTRPKTQETFMEGTPQATAATAHDLGRWPANILHDGSDEVLAVFPESNGQLLAVGPKNGAKSSVNVFGDYGPREQFEPRGDAGSAARFFYCSKADSADRNEGLHRMPQRVVSVWGGDEDDLSAGKKSTVPRANHHPTVKPTDLMRYLCRLVTPRGGLILDPFAGSGSTGKAALLEGFCFVGIELEPEYAAIAEARIYAVAPLFAQPQPVQATL